MDRGAFLRRLASAACGYVDELRGREQLSLSELPRLPDEVLGRIRPAVNEGVEVDVVEGTVRARRPGGGEPVVAFGRSPADAAAFNRFNGRMCISEIARDVAQEMSWDEGRGFRHVRALFLRLVALGVCAPGNAVGADRET